MPSQAWPFAPSDAHGWPAASEGDPQKAPEALYEAKLEVRKKRADQEIERAKAETEADLAVENAYYTAVFESAKGAIDRARASGETVQKAAAAIVTLYTGILTIAFSVADNPLPFRAVYAAILLAIAIVCSTAFLAYLPNVPQSSSTGTSEAARDPGSYMVQFVTWIRQSALKRTYWLRASVLALALAIVFVPAPFVTWTETNSAVSQPNWPTPSSSAGSSIELQKIVYAAQVQEVADVRGGPTSHEKEWLKWVWLGAFIAALIVVFALAAALPG